jgi:hypothetical protein
MIYKVWGGDGRTTPEDLGRLERLGRLGRLEYAGMDWKVWDGLGDVQERLSSLLSY